MISLCANPACRIVFDYRQGQFFRFHKAHRSGEKPPNTHSVQHFWLCGKCAGKYTLLYAEERGVLLQDRSAIAAPAEKCRFVASA
jgi:hypothetical protein